MAYEYASEAKRRRPDVWAAAEHYFKHLQEAPELRPISSAKKDALLRELACRALEMYGFENAAQRLAEYFGADPGGAFRTFASAWKLSPAEDQPPQQSEAQLLAQIKQLQAELAEHPVLDAVVIREQSQGKEGPGGGG